VQIIKACCPASTIRSWHQLLISHMLPVGGTVGPPQAEPAPGVHGSGSSQVSFTPFPSAASASLTGCQICNLETDSEELLKLDSVLSVQLAYPVLQQGTHHSRHVSSAPSFIVLSPHIPLDALGLKITGKRDNRSPDNSALHLLATRRRSSLHTDSVFSRRHLETLQHSDEEVRSEQQPVRNWQGCWSLAKVLVAFCREQCLTCLPLNCPCLFITIFLVLYLYVTVSRSSV
jgi:hypothetical protein